jgi:hypothetical protein
MHCILAIITTGNGKSAKRMALKNLHLIYRYYVMRHAFLISRIFRKILTCLSSRFKKSYLKNASHPPQADAAFESVCALPLDGISTF